MFSGACPKCVLDHNVNHWVCFCRYDNKLDNTWFVGVNYDVILSELQMSELHLVGKFKYHLWTTAVKCEVLGKVWDVHTPSDSLLYVIIFLGNLYCMCEIWVMNIIWLQVCKPP